MSISDDEFAQRMLNLIHDEDDMIVDRRDDKLMYKIRKIISMMDTAKGLGMVGFTGGAKGTTIMVVYVLIVLALRGELSLLNGWVLLLGWLTFVPLGLIVLAKEHLNYRRHCQSLKFLFDNWETECELIQQDYRCEYENLFAEARIGNVVRRLTDRELQPLPTFWQIHERLHDKSKNIAENLTIPNRSAIEKIITAQS